MLCKWTNSTVGWWWNTSETLVRWGEYNPIHGHQHGFMCWLSSAISQNTSNISCVYKQTLESHGDEIPELNWIDWVGMAYNRKDNFHVHHNCPQHSFTNPLSYDCQIRLFFLLKPVCLMMVLLLFGSDDGKYFSAACMKCVSRECNSQMDIFV